MSLLMVAAEAPTIITFNVTAGLSTATTTPLTASAPFPALVYAKA